MRVPPEGARGVLERPVFLVSPPRSGSTLLFQTLSLSPSLCTIGGESHGVIEGIRRLHPAATGWQSNRLSAADAERAIVEELSRRFLATLRDRDGAPAAAGLRMLEKTPKNSLRVPFFAAAFPEASFLFLHRAARSTLSSMIEAWMSGRFRTYRQLPGWPGVPWSLLLVPGWRELAGKPLPEIVARQWAATAGTLVADLAALPAERVHAISYEEFVAAPQATMERICEALGLAWDRELGNALAPSPTTVTAPAPDKWRRHEAAIEAVWPIVAEAEKRAAAFAASRAI